MAEFAFVEGTPEYSERFDFVVIEVSAVGGGTLGATYVGAWQYRVTTLDGAREFERGTDFESGTPMGHPAVASELFDIFCGEE